MKIYKAKAIVYLIMALAYLFIGIMSPYWYATVGFGIIAVAYAFLGGYDSCAYNESKEGDNQNGRGGQV